MSGAEAAAADHGDFGHDAVGDGVDHFCAGADDAAPLGVFADHEAVDVVQENQRDAVLVAVEDEARGFFGGLGVDDAAEFDALLVGAAGERVDVFFLVGDDADGPAADARVAAENVSPYSARYSSNSLASTMRAMISRMSYCLPGSLEKMP